MSSFGGGMEHLDVGGNRRSRCDWNFFSSLYWESIAATLKLKSVPSILSKILKYMYFKCSAT